MEKNLDSLPLLRERYGYLRAEILQRLDNRYKLLTITMTLITVGFTVIYQLKWHSISLPVCACLLALTIILQGESRHIRLIAKYLTKLETELDISYKLLTPGWRNTARK